MPKPKTTKKAITKSPKKTVRKTTKKVLKPDEGITLHCYDNHTTIPKADVLENVGRFARKCGLGAYSVYNSPSGRASAMNEANVSGYEGAELWITGRDKPSAN